MHICIINHINNAYKYLHMIIDSFSFFFLSLDYACHFNQINFEKIYNFVLYPSLIILITYVNLI